MTDKPKLTVSVKGRDAVDGDAIADVVETMLKTGLGLVCSIVGTGWKCDRCGTEVSGNERPATWTKNGPDDLCETCSEGQPA